MHEAGSGAPLAAFPIASSLAFEDVSQGACPASERGLHVVSTAKVQAYLQNWKCVCVCVCVWRVTFFFSREDLSWTPEFSLGTATCGLLKGCGLRDPGAEAGEQPGTFSGAARGSPGGVTAHRRGLGAAGGAAGDAEPGTAARVRDRSTQGGLCCPCHSVPGTQLENICQVIFLL